jgi:hypothetical protein
MVTTPKCCKCAGKTPLFRCICSCHNQDDCTYWETLAFIWICDAPDDARRQDAWQRFCTAYPDYQNETCEQFWDRILSTKWYKNKGHHHDHHHHPYHHHDHDPGPNHEHR